MGSVKLYNNILYKRSFLLVIIITKLVDMPR